ncbi:hypothetical protein ACQKKX_16760 [Neorhizobium sp. NPDC001467]|uniref:hypothetical protein n=1 Tax=Neorhizobium sp. NPDC001467 TaxID=3390595 RepID=UPI003CFFFD87
MSGLEKAIRNALAQSERNNADIRARIYHSARQALAAGLRKQDVTDPDLIEAQRQRLEAKIREIEFEERQRLAIERAQAPAAQTPEPTQPTATVAAEPRPFQTPASAPQAAPSVTAPSRTPLGAPPAGASTAGAHSLGAPHLDAADIGAPDVTSSATAAGSVVPAQDRQTTGSRNPYARPPQPSAERIAAANRHDDDLETFVGGPRRSGGTDGLGDAGNLGDLGVSRRSGNDQPAELRPRQEIDAEKPRPRRWWQGKPRAETGRPVGRSAKPGVAPPVLAADRQARPRKRRRWISGLVLPLAVLGAAVWGLWWAGENGLIVVPDLSETANTAVNGNSQAPSGFAPGRGFSQDWAEVFVPDEQQNPVAGASAAVETVTASGGKAVRIASRASGAEGEVAFDVPADILRQMAGRSSTVAITLQTAADRSVEVSVRCDFGSLGDCSRHRFRATQEKTDALFRVNFDRSLAPTQAGRIYLNSDVRGGNLPVYVFSLRILPGQ